MRLTEAAVPVFARHETFHPRYGWFRKAYRSVAENPYIFDSEDAPVRIGVGKNMVRAIRFWGLAAGLIEPDSESRLRRKPIEGTPFGDRLFADAGWDPWMEDPGTLWLLHWRLLATPCQLPVWWLAFNEFHPIEFTDDDLEDAVAAQLDANADWKTPHRSSVRKDVSALLRTYAPQERTKRTSIDDVLDCPLRELNLIRRATAPGRYRFILGTKPTLPSEVATAAALEYAAETVAGGKSIAVSRLAHDPGSPGRAFKLTEEELVEALEPTVRRTKGVRLTSSTGAHVLSWRGSPGGLAHRVLDGYYRAEAQ
ncbi:MAG: DUF4007 family protein [Acidobacteria bacterium]|nr:DUF4007 family protein [Acidobacteriota bacterium]MYH21969.1 DUF4007 family protein [Acidobacteriota bacterium]MYK79632.1 DUF4007 family protein [Acidobacteriota bacterium]